MNMLTNPYTNKILKKNNRNMLEDSPDGEKFYIINNIPRIIKNFDNNDRDMWGEQWEKYYSTQLDSVTGSDVSLNRIKFILGGDLKVLQNKTVLEVGSGAGRFTEILAKYAKKLVTTDLSRAIDVNYKNNSHFKNTEFIQADINSLPFEKNSFDYVVCVGVLQHTIDTELSIQNLWSHVGNNGYLIIDHYQFKLKTLFSTGELFRFFIKKMSRDKAFKFTRKMVDLFFPIFFKFRNNKKIIKILKKIIPLGIEADGTTDHMDRNTLKEWTYLDTHDGLADPIKRLITKKKLEKIINSLNASKLEMISEMRPGSNGLECRVKKMII